jgi:hypothetical protein
VTRRRGTRRTWFFSTKRASPRICCGAIDGPGFLANAEQILVTALHAGDIVIGDNLSARNVAGVPRAIERAGVSLWYLPPSSPDLNAIERCFAKLNAIVRTARSRTMTRCGRSLANASSSSAPRKAGTLSAMPATRAQHDHEICSSRPW